MYNDNCKTTDEISPARVNPAQTMKDMFLEVHEMNLKARAIACEIYVNLFGNMDMSIDETKTECAYDVLEDIKRIDNDLLNILMTIVDRIGR